MNKCHNAKNHTEAYANDHMTLLVNHTRSKSIAILRTSNYSRGAVSNYQYTVRVDLRDFLVKSAILANVVCCPYLASNHCDLMSNYASTYADLLGIQCTAGGA